MNYRTKLVCPHCRDDLFIRRHDVVVRACKDGDDINVEAIREFADWPLQCMNCLETMAAEELVISDGLRPRDCVKGGAP